MGKVDVPKTEGKLFMWEGFSSVANNNITTPIKPILGRIAAFINCAGHKTNCTITRMDIYIIYPDTIHGQIQSLMPQYLIKKLQLLNLHALILFISHRALFYFSNIYHILA